MLNKIWHVLLFHLKQALSAPRIPLLFILIAIFIFSNVQPVSEFANEVGIDATPWAFSHITSDYICQLVIMAVVIFLFCDAPFNSAAHSYILPRAGYTAWGIGTCLYIVVLSLLYVLLIQIISIMALLPNIVFQLGWGKIWGTLARTTAATQYGIPFTVYDYIIGAYTPLQANLTSFLLEWACCTWLGLVIYFFNNASGTMVGSLIAAGFVFLDITIANEWSYSFFRYSPVTLAQLPAISRVESLYGLSLSYAVRFFSISIFLLVCLCVLTPLIKRKIWVIVQRRGMRNV